MSNGHSTIESRIASSMLLFAFGDAWGFVTEFMSHEEILKTRPEPPSRLIISDDTQMSLYTIAAVKELHESGLAFTDPEIVDALLTDDNETLNHVRRKFAEKYSVFAADTDNNRAPGGTVMSALAEYEKTPAKTTGREGGGTNNSLGCGTVMRAPWIGLLPYDKEVLVVLSILQAQVTHGDPAGWLVSAVSTALTHELLVDSAKVEYSSLFSHALSILDDIDDMDTSLIKEMREPRKNESSTPGAVLPSAFDTVRKDLTELAESFDSDSETVLAHENIDVTSFYGEGWIADEAFYNALAIASMYGTSAGDTETVFQGIKRLVYTNGDSDSIAAIGGALLGANVNVSISQSKKREIHSALEARYRAEVSTIGSFILDQWNPGTKTV